MFHFCNCCEYLILCFCEWWWREYFTWNVFHTFSHLQAHKCTNSTMKQWINQLRINRWNIHQAVFHPEIQEKEIHTIRGKFGIDESLWMQDKILVVKYKKKKKKETKKKIHVVSGKHGIDESLWMQDKILSEVDWKDNLVRISLVLYIDRRSCSPFSVVPLYYKRKERGNFALRRQRRRLAERKKEQGASTMAVRRAAVEKLTLKVPVAVSHSHFRRVPVARFFHEPFHWDDDNEDVSWKILRATKTARELAVYSWRRQKWEEHLFLSLSLSLSLSLCNIDVWSVAE